MFHRSISRTRSARPVLIGLGTMTAVAAAVLFAPMTAMADPGDEDFLGTAEDYAIISADTITDTATHGTVVIGDVALTPGTDQQLLVVQVEGEIHVGDTAADTANLDLNTAYVILADTDATETVGTVNLAARVTPYLAGVYFSGSDLLLDGTMVLSGGADDVFIFQASTGALTVMAGSAVQLTGGVQACNVYWQVGSSATLGVDSTFVGSILAATSIAAQDGAQITGQLLAGAANAGAVTLDDNLINSGSACARAAVIPVEEEEEEEEQQEEEQEEESEEETEETTTSDEEDDTTTAVLGVSAVNPSVLAETGVDVMPLTAAAALLLGFGVLGLVVSRRSRPETDTI
jgi:ribosomal protein L12E/L44/L45/RPP1/RPP2